MSTLSVEERNREASRLEVEAWKATRPVRYFLYITESDALKLRGKPNAPCGNVGPQHEGIATTWTGERLGTVLFGRPYRDNVNGERVPITVLGSNGYRYHGTYYRSAGSYTRIQQYRGTK